MFPNPSRKRFIYEDNDYGSQFDQLVSQFRENEQDELEGNICDSPGPGQYLDIYKGSCFNKGKPKRDHMGLVAGRFHQKSDQQTILASIRGPGAYESNIMPIMVRTACIYALET